MKLKTNFIKLVTTTALVCTCINLPVLHADAPLEPVTSGFEKTTIHDGFADLVEVIQPAVVSISVKSSVIPATGKSELGNQPEEPEKHFKRFFGENFGLPGSEKMQPVPRNANAVGSGFIIDPSGLVVTNHHVIQNASKIEVVLNDGTSVTAELKGTDPKTDLALLQITQDGPYPFVAFGDSGASQIGDWVVAVGNPFGLGGTTTKGIISARGRDIGSGPLDDFIQIDAPINRGNSGGPLFNMSGEVIGVNSAIFSPNGGSVGIGFAIPSAIAENVIGQIRDTGSVERGYLGVNIQKVSKEIADGFGLPDARGALITDVVEDSPAYKARLQSGDIILNFNDQQINNVRDLPKLVAMMPSGEKVDVVIWRENQAKTIRLSVGKQNEVQTVAALEVDSEAGKLGMTLQNLDKNSRSQLGLNEADDGVLVTNIEQDSPAAEQGLTSGDVIKKIGSDEVSDLKQVENAIQDIRNEQFDSVLMLVQRGDNSRYIAIPFEAQNS